MPASFAPRLAAGLVAASLLLVPALWNGFPLLFYDSGIYLFPIVSGVADPILPPGRSAVYGYFLGAGRFFDFWPVVAVQSLLAVWIVALTLRAHDLAGRPILLLALFALFTAATALPWLTGQLMPDFLAGVAVLALYLVVFHADRLARVERVALVAFIAFAAAAHNATLAVLALLFLAGLAVRLIRPALVPAPGLARIAGALVLGAALLLAANYSVVGRLAWTPGGTAFAFSRLVHDGIVHRFLDDNCPNPRYQLCQHRNALPRHANDFLWHQGAAGPFAAIGGFTGGADEMREIALESLRQYPLLHLRSALGSTAEQLFAVGTGWGIVHDVWDAYGHIERLVPDAVPAAHGARQRHKQLHFEAINRLHVPLAWLSMFAVAAFLARAWRRGETTPLTALAATIAAALLANAFVCGALSNPHDRYGARIAWIATLFLAIALARAVPLPLWARSVRWPSWVQPRTPRPLYLRRPPKGP